MTTVEFKNNLKAALDACDSGTVVNITRRGRVYQIKLVSV